MSWNLSFPQSIAWVSKVFSLLFYLWHLQSLLLTLSRRLICPCRHLSCWLISCLTFQCRSGSLSRCIPSIEGLIVRRWLIDITTAASLVKATSIVVVLPVIIVELAWLFLGCSEGLLEVFILQVHALLYVQVRLHCRFQISHDGRITGISVPDGYCIATELGWEYQAQDFTTGNSELLTYHSHE